MYREAGLESGSRENRQVCHGGKQVSDQEQTRIVRLQEIVLVKRLP